MNRVAEVAKLSFAQNFEAFHARVVELCQAVSEDQFFTKPFPYGNSLGNLVLHLTGNLNYYIGTVIEHTGYVRNRELEFAEVRGKSRDEVLAEFGKAIAMVMQSLAAQNEEDWTRHYEATGVTDVQNRFGIYLRCCMHIHHHIGQMIYLVKEWNKQSSK